MRPVTTALLTSKPRTYCLDYCARIIRLPERCWDQQDLLRSPSIESIKRKISDRGMLGKESPTSVDLPLSNESKRVLAYAAEEAERLAHKHIGTEHLLLGLLREKNLLPHNC